MMKCFHVFVFVAFKDLGEFFFYIYLEQNYLDLQSSPTFFNFDW